MSYPELFAALTPLVTQSGGALWLQQMTFGPARELCLHTPAPVEVPAVFDPLQLTLERVWPS